MRSSVRVAAGEMQSIGQRPNLVDHGQIDARVHGTPYFQGSSGGSCFLCFTGTTTPTVVVVVVVAAAAALRFAAIGGVPLIFCFFFCRFRMLSRSTGNGF